MRVFPALILLCLLLATIVPVSAVSPGVIKTIGPVQTQTTRLVFSPVITTTEIPEEDGMGFIIIESDPAGAEIEIFFAGMGGHTNFTTPYSSPAFASGTVYPYLIVLKKPGYKVYSEQVAVQPKQTYTIHAVLIPLTTTPVPGQTSAQPAATAVITAPPYYANPEAPMPGAASPATTAMAAGQPSPASAPGTGSLSVATTPSGAAIEIDGIPAGASPATVPGLAAGTHNLTITMPGYAALITQVNIVGGQTMEYSTTLIPATDPTRKQTPGFEAAVAGIALACIVLLKRRI